MRRRALGQLEFCEGGEQARGGPGLPVGPFGELRPVCRHGGQAQLAEQERQAGDVDGHGPAHDAAPRLGSSTS